MNLYDDFRQTPNKLYYYSYSCCFWIIISLIHCFIINNKKYDNNGVGLTAAPPVVMRPMAWTLSCQAPAFAHAADSAIRDSENDDNKKSTLESNRPGEAWRPCTGQQTAAAAAASPSRWFHLDTHATVVVQHWYYTDHTQHLTITGVNINVYTVSIVIFRIYRKKPSFTAFRSRHYAFWPSWSATDLYTHSLYIP